MARKIVPTTTFDATEAARKVWLAGLGALSIAEEEGSKFFKTLVDKGKKTTDWADLPDRTMTEAKSRFKVTAKKVEEGFDEKMQMVLHRIGVPTRDEIETLTKRVEALTRTMTKDKGGRRTRGSKTTVEA